MRPPVPALLLLMLLHR
jgi:hypothetical protein